MQRFSHISRGLWGLSASVLVLSATFIGATAKITPTADPVSPSPAHASSPDGQQIYMTRCMACHRMEGEGMAGIFPPLDGTEWVTGDKQRLIRIVLHGLSGEIEVDGEIYSGAMPGWQTLLSDDEIAAVLTFIRSEWSNDASAVSAEEVAAVRKETGDRKGPWTVDDLEKVAQ